MKKDLKILQKSTPTNLNLDSQSSEIFEDPAATNAQIAAKMGIEYPPDFDDDEDEKNEIEFKSKLILSTFIDSKSPDPFAKNAQEELKFNNHDEFKEPEPPSISDINPNKEGEENRRYEDQDIPIEESKFKGKPKIGKNLLKKIIEITLK